MWFCDQDLHRNAEHSELDVVPRFPVFAWHVGQEIERPAPADELRTEPMQA